MNKSKKLRNKKNTTRKRKRNLFPIKKINNIVSKEHAHKLKKMLSHFFEKEILSKIDQCPRPIKKKYGDFLERSKGRFEITPPPCLENKIWNLLIENASFVKLRNDLKAIIVNNTNHTQCIEELCILPVEPNTKSGNWHRDIFIKSKTDFDKEPYYITQIIYLDDKANTKFCINSQNNSNKNVNLYSKKLIKAAPLSSVVFDGRTLHKGLENNSKETRYAIYISYYDSNYVDKESIQKKILHKDQLC